MHCPVPSAQCPAPAHYITRILYVGMYMYMYLHNIQYTQLRAGAGPSLMQTFRNYFSTVNTVADNNPEYPKAEGEPFFTIIYPPPSSRGSFASAR
jgi:hypothetical protein